MAGERQFVCFNLGEEIYGIGITSVKTIEKVMNITKLPQLPDYIEGIVNLRGIVIPIIDLRKRLGIGKTDYNEETRFIFVEVQNTLVGFIVDKVTEVLRIPDNIIESIPVIGQDLTFISGIAKLEDQLIILLNTDKIFTTGEMAEIDKAGHGLENQM